MARVNPIPEGTHTVTPSLVLRDCAKAIEFYKKALGATEVSRFAAPDGKSIWHAELRIGDSVVYMNDEMPGMSPPPPDATRRAPVTMWLHVKDCDASYKQAIDAGEVKGTIRYYGCPAEEGGAGKAFMAKAGTFDDVDVCLTWHPDTFNGTMYVNFLANYRVLFKFHGKTAHAAADRHGRC